MGFSKRPVKRWGQSPKPRQEPQPRQSPAGSSLLLPSLEEIRPTPRPSQISGLEDTVASDEASIQKGGNRTETPTVETPVSRPPPVPAQNEESRITRAISVAASQLREIDQKDIEPDRLPVIVQTLQRRLNELHDIRLEEIQNPQRNKEELLRLNCSIEAVNRKVEQLNNILSVQRAREKGERNQTPPSIPPAAVAPSIAPAPTLQVTRPIQQEAGHAQRGNAGPSALRRAATSPMTWAIAGISAFTAVLLHQDAFRDIAETIGRVLKTDTPSAKTVAIIYGAVAAVSLGVTAAVNMLRNRSADRRETEKLRQQNQGPTTMGPGEA